ncbi:flagellin lysine-N-methylase [Aeromonas allosaccharophila]|uniref:Flagellin lysine-N-methylase n=1 Tax=Aeromonas veronii TaxID=654 RepID=A0A6S5YWT9_AERVE|nr:MULTISPECIES: flagellin lysine-N-methylase [Aeromonas]BBR39476.1 flagellin lysine-N-methylase [Aeromonas veronii]BBU04925.1 flagellin lysine-N-methylase [Aeromonas veronii]
MPMLTRLVPRFRSTFHCIGPACEEHCCQGWSIQIDKPTFRLYWFSDDERIRAMARGCLQKTKSSDDDWGRMKLDEQGVCPFLDSDKLCTIHRRLGEQALSNTCSTYPRSTVSFLNQQKDSLTLSCPEACRQLLLDPDAMLIESQEQAAASLFLAVPDAALRLNQLSYQIALTQELSLEMRLWMIGMLIHHDEGNSSYEQFLDELVALLEKGQLQAMYDTIPSLPNVQWWALRTLTNLLLQSNDTNHRGRAMIEECLDTLYKLLDGEYDQEKMAFFPRLWREQVAPFLAARPHLLDNYLLYQIYNFNFPYRNEHSMESAYRLLVADLFLLRSYFCLLAHQGELTEENVIKLVYSYHARRQHNLSFEQELATGLLETGFSSDITLYALLNLS